MKARSGVEHQFSAGIAEIRNAAESSNGFMAQVMKQFQAPVVMGAIFNESNGLPPDYESGGQRFESVRARHFQRHSVRFARHSHDIRCYSWKFFDGHVPLLLAFGSL